MFFSCSGNRACLLARALKVLADSGYQGIKKYHKNSEIPTKSSKHKPLDKEKREYNRQVASQRIGNEHTIGFIKRFRMVAGRYRNRLRRFSLRFTLLLPSAILK